MDALKDRLRATEEANQELVLKIKKTQDTGVANDQSMHYETGM
jgi:hypothetical protein